MADRRKVILATCCGVHGLQDGLANLVYVLLPVLAQAFGLSYAQVGIIRAANNTAMTLFELPSGLLSERLGERILLVFGLACAGIGFVALGMATGFLVILLSLFVVGLGAAFQHALSSSVISKTYEDGGRRAALGVYNSSGDFGKLAFAGLFTLLFGAGVAWHGVVTAFGLLALIAAIILYILLRALDAGARPVETITATDSPPSSGWGIRDRTGFTALSVIVFLDITVQGGFLTFLAFLMIEKQVPTSLAAFAVVLTLAGGAFGKFGCGLLAERLGVIRSLILVECLTAIGIVAVLLAPTLVAYFLLPVLGVVLQGSSSITYGTVSDLIDRERQSRGFGMIYSIASGASIVSPILFGYIGDRYGLTPAMLAMSGVVMLPVPLCIFLRPALSPKSA
jgi:MFS family permease